VKVGVDSEHGEIFSESQKKG